MKKKIKHGIEIPRKKAKASKTKNKNSKYPSIEEINKLERKLDEQNINIDIEELYKLIQEADEDTK
ncbi:MAG: hypothetical protein LLG13_12835 [Bacteroidales bacterium]|nr:hypothetical protein [Bacteroidales bacterium]